jgi:hypothetical protein
MLIKMLINMLINMLMLVKQNSFTHLRVLLVLTEHGVYIRTPILFAVCGRPYVYPCLPP